MQKIKFFKNIFQLLIIFSILVVIGCSGDVDLRKQPAAFSLQAASLFQEFSDNESDSNKKYVGKILDVMGTIKGITSGNDGTIVLLLETNNVGDVQCNFTKEFSPDVKKMKVGNTINIKGINSGFLFDVMLDKCVIM